MRTKIRGEWVVGHKDGHHTLIRNGEVVYEGERVVFVGKGFEGACDETIDAAGMLVAPGFIDAHVHAGYQASQRLISDVGRPEYFGQPFLEFNVAKRGMVVGGDPRYFSDEKRKAFTSDPWALFTAAELLRNGITTFVEMGAPVHMQEQLAAAVEKLGTRAYLGAGYDVGGWVGGEDGRLERAQDQAYGDRVFKDAISFSKRIDGLAGGRLRAILSPKRVETCSRQQLEDTARLARELSYPVCIHAAYNVHEFYDMLRLHHKTSIEYLDEVGLLSLGATFTVGHGNFVAEHPKLIYSGGGDIDLMGRCGCSVSHCSVNLVRRGRFLDSWKKYKKAGVNIALGTDTFPRDMIMQMRTASYFGKVIADDLKSATAAEVFEAATVNGARSLGREDLGRLHPGSKADIIMIKLRNDTSLRHGPVRDPIKGLVDTGIGDDVDTVVVAGKVCMRNGEIPGVNYRELQDAAQRMGEYIWNDWATWDTLGRTAEEMSPFSFPLE
jgi:5-methylthioadenosine/S-adenosylhomocysteine deaminase